MDTLLATVIHDAKNGLATLGAWLEQARAQTPSPALEEACRQAQRINTQLVELLALHRGSEGTLRLAIADHDLADFVDDLKAEWLAPPQSTITVSWPADAGRIGAWAFDAYQVKLVLLDVLRNALRHARTTVALRLAVEPGGGIRFTVQDDGPGFPVAHSATMHDQGSGLGLSFARLIAREHRTPNGKHGDIEMKNAPQGGALFSLILP
ncbi:MAG: HAMP domain-containing histidine kinase [Rhodocyclaceae bacterium]|nr:MAG: HAMP domain-containing histidine kinase [Rhodocyclaceae bacterium]